MEENYPIYETWNFFQTNFRDLLDNEIFLWVIIGTALLFFLLGRLSK
ncbi:MAG TPA: hypothetical protein VJ934_02775 [Desulfomicrobiaceae bacterium]|jgi:hypothetical protein|nr:hypothetical protein [Desulfomicrobiaceae bacterium]